MGSGEWRRSAAGPRRLPKHWPSRGWGCGGGSGPSTTATTSSTTSTRAATGPRSRPPARIRVTSAGIRVTWPAFVSLGGCHDAVRGPAPSRRSGLCAGPPRQVSKRGGAFCGCRGARSSAPGRRANESRWDLGRRAGVTACAWRAVGLSAAD